MLLQVRLPGLQAGGELGGKVPVAVKLHRAFVVVVPVYLAAPGLGKHLALQQGGGQDALLLHVPAHLLGQQGDGGGHLLLVHPDALLLEKGDNLRPGLGLLAPVPGPPVGGEGQQTQVGCQQDTYDDILTRDNLIGHFSSSAFVVNKERSKMLCVYHIINDGWIYPGGHADGEANLLAVALREVEEETGLKPKLLDENIFSIQACATNGHVKRGKYVPAHIHFDVVYIMEADELEALSFREDESKGVKWIAFEDATNQDIVDFIITYFAPLRNIDKQPKIRYAN